MFYGCTRADTGACESQVGTNAEKIPEGSKEVNATMWLNLSDGDRHKEFLVMHEFGHALGLGHEHQRSNNFGKFFQINLLKKYFGSQYVRDVEKKEDPGSRSLYDPDSIMHYW